MGKKDHLINKQQYFTLFYVKINLKRKYMLKQSKIKKGQEKYIQLLQSFTKNILYKNKVFTISCN